MTPEIVAMMVIIPVSLMGVIGLVLLSGRMSPAVRRRVELAFVGIFYPAMVAYWGWRTVETVMERDWIVAAFAAALTVVMAIQGVKLIRKPLSVDGTRT